LFYATHDLPLDETIHAAKICLALTADDVQAAFARWVHPENFVQASLGRSPGEQDEGMATVDFRATRCH
jgi:predicted Zn-dependent peptidase